MSGIFKTPGKDDYGYWIGQAIFGPLAGHQKNGLLDGTAYEARKQRAWLKAKIISTDLERLGVREDLYGARIRWTDYGNRDSGFGWEIDHKMPQASGGTDNYGNLQPLYWRTNVEKSDKIFFFAPYRWSVLYGRNIKVS